MTSFSTKVRTAAAIGFPNICRVLLYRFCVSTGFNPVRRIQATVPVGPFYGAVVRTIPDLPVLPQWRTEFHYFSWFSFALSASPPDWLMNPLTRIRFGQPERHWYRIPDFDPVVGDIKVIWEISRFGWVLAFAQRISSGESDALNLLNTWLTDWCAKNPPYYGPNWKCGQEASIRVMHLAMAALILGQTDKTTCGLAELVKLHLKRIAPTINYAIAQDNNHGTSEAAALFIGGSWLERLGVDEGRGWHRLGRKWLENRAVHLVEEDGSFSQYSLNYHRVVLDTFSMVEVWRRQLKLSEFSEAFTRRAASASRWLAMMVDTRTGDAPNLGANDGARLLPLTDTDYRDFRPTVQLAMALFTGERAYADDGPWNSQLAWLGVALPDKFAKPPGSKVFDNGGYAVLRRGESMALLRYPRFRFRPSHADLLHVDLWFRGENLLRDAGTYSYNTKPEWQQYFPGTASHNTVQFDGRDQMPRLSRFLYGDWLKTESVQPLVELAGESSSGASYRDRQGAKHLRSLKLTDDRLIVCDEIEGFKYKAVLRWRVKPGQWHFDGRSLTDGKDVLKVSASMPIIRIELVSGWESRYYLQKTSIPVLEIEVNEPGIFTTEYSWQ